jgi:hypothetical protein
MRNHNRLIFQVPMMIYQRASTKFIEQLTGSQRSPEKRSKNKQIELLYREFSFYARDHTKVKVE